MKREHRRKTDNDVVKVCNKCQEEKPHYWIKDKRRLRGGYPSPCCRECKSLYINDFRKIDSIKKEPSLFTCQSCSHHKLHDWIVDRRNTKGGYYRSICQECHKDDIVVRWRLLKSTAVDYLGGKCLDCGLADDCKAVYDFHHRDPAHKSFSISSQIKSRSIRQLDELKPELDKCDLLCANCHRRRHDTERQRRSKQPLEASAETEPDLPSTE